MPGRPMKNILKILPLALALGILASCGDDQEATEPTRDVSGSDPLNQNLIDVIRTPTISGAKIVAEPGMVYINVPPGQTGREKVRLINQGDVVATLGGVLISRPDPNTRLEQHGSCRSGMALYPGDFCDIIVARWDPEGLSYRNEIFIKTEATPNLTPEIRIPLGAGPWTPPAGWVDPLALENYDRNGSTGNLANLPDRNSDLISRLGQGIAGNGDGTSGSDGRSSDGTGGAGGEGGLQGTGGEGGQGTTGVGGSGGVGAAGVGGRDTQTNSTERNGGQGTGNGTAGGGNNSSTVRETSRELRESGGQTNSQNNTSRESGSNDRSTSGTGGDNSSSNNGQSRDGAGNNSQNSSASDGKDQSGAGTNNRSSNDGTSSQGAGENTRSNSDGNQNNSGQDNANSTGGAGTNNQSSNDGTSSQGAGENSRSNSDGNQNNSGQGNSNSTGGADRNATGQNTSGLDGAGQSGNRVIMGSGRDGAGGDGFGRDGSGRDGAGSDGFGRNGADTWGASGANGWGNDGTAGDSGNGISEEDRKLAQHLASVLEARRKSGFGEISRNSFGIGGSADVQKRTSDVRYDKDKFAWTDASLPVDRRHILTADRVVKAVLETAFTNIACTQVIAVAESDVYSPDHSNILIPVGTRFIGKCSGFVDERALIEWTRFITPNGISAKIVGTASDPMGRGGVPGRLDRRWFERFGMPLVFSAIKSVGRYFLGEDRNVTVNVDNGVSTSNESAKNEALDQFGEDTEKALEKLFEEIQDVRQVLTIPGGSKIDIVFSEDVYFKTPYEVVSVAGVEYELKKPERPAQLEQAAPRDLKAYPDGELPPETESIMTIDIQGTRYKLVPAGENNSRSAQ